MDDMAHGKIKTQKHTERAPATFHFSWTREYMSFHFDFGFIPLFDDHYLIWWPKKRLKTSVKGPLRIANCLPCHKTERLRTEETKERVAEIYQ
jgi:hypothetical protein